MQFQHLCSCISLYYTQLYLAGKKTLYYLCSKVQEIRFAEDASQYIMFDERKLTCKKEVFNISTWPQFNIYDGNYFCVVSTK